MKNKHIKTFNESEGLPGTPGYIHIELKQTLEKWLLHYTNEEVMEQIKDKHLSIEDIYDQEMIEGEDIHLAIKLLRRM